MTFHRLLARNAQEPPAPSLQRGRAAAVTNAPRERHPTLLPRPTYDGPAQAPGEYRWTCVLGCRSRRTWARPGAAQLGGNEHTRKAGPEHATAPEPAGATS